MLKNLHLINKTKSMLDILTLLEIRHDFCYVMVCQN